jgi:hypothetical protein
MPAQDGAPLLASRQRRLNGLVEADSTAAGAPKQESMPDFRALKYTATFTMPLMPLRGTEKGIFLSLVSLNCCPYKDTIYANASCLMFAVLYSCRFKSLSGQA